MLKDVDWIRVLEVGGKILTALVVLIMLFVFVYRVRMILPPFVIAVVLSYVLNPVVYYGERRGLSRTQAIAATYLVLAVLSGVIIFFIAPVLINEVNRLAANTPRYISQMQDTLGELERIYEATAIPTTIREAINHSLEDFLLTLEERLIGFLTGVMVGIGGVFSALFYFILGNILAIYFLHDSKEFYESFEQLLPQRYRPAVLSFANDIDRVVSGFVHGRFIISAVVGVLATLILAILGVRFYLILGLVAGLTNLIPYFGPFIGAVPAVLLASFQSGRLAVQVLIVYLIIQQLDGFILSPRVLSRSTGLHPLAVVFAIMAFGSLFGWWGLFFGVPMGAIAKVCLDYIFRWVSPT